MSRSVRPVRSGRRLRRVVVGLATLVTLGALVPASAAAPPKTPVGQPTKATFGIGPATAKRLDGRPDLNYETSAGAHFSDHVAVVNLAAKPVTLNLYTADAVNGANGAIGYDPKAAPGTGARRWITLHTSDGRPSISLAAHQTKIVALDVTVPAKAEPGDHLAAVIVSLTSKVEGKGSTGANFEQRVALRAFFRLSGTLNPALRIDNLGATYHNLLNPFGAGSATVSYTVRNVGNVDLGGRQAVKLTGIFGSTGSVSTLAAVPVLLPGGSYSTHVTVQHVWPEIFMHARATVTPAGVVGAANPPLHTVSAQTGFYAIPWALLVLLVLVAALILGVTRWRRRRASYEARHPKAGGRTPVLSGKA